jgi:hypothetical protein
MRRSLYYMTYMKAPGSRPRTPRSQKQPSGQPNPLNGKYWEGHEDIFNATGLAEEGLEAGAKTPRRTRGALRATIPPPPPRRKRVPQSLPDPTGNGQNVAEAIFEKSKTAEKPSTERKQKKEPVVKAGAKADTPVASVDWGPGYSADLEGGHRKGIEADYDWRKAEDYDPAEDLEMKPLDVEPAPEEKKIRSFAQEALKNPELAELFDKATKTEFEYRNHEGGWRYLVRKASFGKIGGKKLEALRSASEEARNTWSDKVGERITAAYAMGEARAQESVDGVKDPQAKNFARLGSKKVLERYRGVLAHGVMRTQMESYYAQLGTLQQEKWDKSSRFTKAAVKALAWYGKRSTATKIAIGSGFLIAGSGAAVMGGGVALGVGAATAGIGAARLAFSLTGGRIIAEGVARGLSVISRDKKRQAKRAQNIAGAKAKGAEDFKRAVGLDKAAGTKQAGDAMRAYAALKKEDFEKLKTDRRRSNLIKTITTAGIGLGGTAYMIHEHLPERLLGIYENAGKSGAAIDTEPQLSPGDYSAGRSGAAIDTEPSLSPGDYSAGRSGAAIDTEPSLSPGDYNAGRSGAAIDTEPQLAPGDSNAGKAGTSFSDPQEPGIYEQDNVTGVDDAVRQNWVYNGGPQPTASVEHMTDVALQDDDIGVPRPVGPEDFEPKASAPSEPFVIQDDATGVDDQVRRVENAGMVDKAKGLFREAERVFGLNEPRGPRGTNAVVEPNAFNPNPVFRGVITVKPGDNLSFIIKDALKSTGHLDNLSLREADTLVGKYVDHLRHQPAGALKEMGFPKPENLDLLYPGNKLALSSINDENLYGAFVGEVKGVPQGSGVAEAPRPQAPVEQAPSAPAFDITARTNEIMSAQVRDIFSTRRFFLGPKTDGFAEFRRISWQRADTFVSDASVGSDPTLNGPKAEALRNLLRSAQAQGVDLRTNIEKVLERMARLAAEREAGSAGR